MVKMSNQEATKKLMDCASVAIRDINKIRSKKKSSSSAFLHMGQDPAVPYLESILYGNYEGSLGGSCCYAIGNLGANWSASKLFSDKLSPEFKNKTEEIKMCKGLIKDFCNNKYGNL